MCWRGKNIPKVAGENTTAFKIAIFELDGVRPYYMRELLQYEKYRDYSVHFKIVPLSDNEVEIQDGLHCYRLGKVQLLEYQYQYGFGEILKVGLPESYLNCFGRRKQDAYANTDSKYAILKYMLCQIPEGTIYYENDCGEIVAEKLKVLDIENLSTVWTREKLLREQLLTNQII